MLRALANLVTFACVAGIVAIPCYLFEVYTR